LSRNSHKRRDFPTWCPWRAPSPFRNDLWYCEMFHHFQKAFAHKSLDFSKFA